MMHVALYTPAWPLERFHNGIVTFVHWMRRELENLGHTVSVFTSQLDSTDCDPRVHLVSNRGWRASAVRVAHRLRLGDDPLWRFGEAIAQAILAVHRDDPIDIIEMEESFGWMAAVQRTTRIPVLVKLHGPAFLSLTDEERCTPLGKERIRREGLALAKMQAIAAPSRDTLERTLRFHGLDPGIREHVVNPMVADGLPIWKLEGSNPGSVLFVGRFDRRKGADVLLRAFAAMALARPDISLTFVGPDSGLLGDDGRKVHFQTYLDALMPEAARSRVRFCGRMSNHEIAALRMSARAIVVASRWENQGYTVLEALMQGCPLVASDVGGNPESVIDGQTGCLARTEDAESFAAQLMRVLDNPAEAARLGAEARRRVMVEHSAQTVAEQSVSLYRRTIDQIAYDHLR